MLRASIIPHNSLNIKALTAKFHRSQTPRCDFRFPKSYELITCQRSVSRLHMNHYFWIVVIQSVVTTYMVTTVPFRN
jgi:hypothetical protein